MVETNPQIESYPPADAPVILHEGLNIRVPVVAYHAPALGVAAELSKESVGVPVLRVVRHSRRTGKVIGTQIGAGGLVLFHFAGPLVVEPGLDIVFAPHLADGVVEAIDIVPIGGGALPSGGATWVAQDGLIRHLSGKVEIRDGDLEILAAGREPGPLLVLVFLEIRIGCKIGERGRVAHG